MANRFGVYLTLSILEILFCSGVLAIPALVYAVMMNTAHKEGNTAQFVRYRNNSRAWLVAAFILGLLILTLYYFLLYDG